MPMEWELGSLEGCVVRATTEQVGATTSMTLFAISKAVPIVGGPLRHSGETSAKIAPAGKMGSPPTIVASSEATVSDSPL